MRYSERPAKQFLFNLLRKKFALSRERQIGLDVACGKMIFRPWFETRRYIGVDLDAGRIREGREKYPEAEGVVCAMEEMDPALRGDFVACIQAIGINSHFDPGNTLACVRKLAEATNEGGILIFNAGLPDGSSGEKIEALLRPHFASVEAVPYGAFNAPIGRPAAYVMAQAMNVLPFLRTVAGERRVLYTCTGRKHAA